MKSYFLTLLFLITCSTKRPITLEVSKQPINSLAADCGANIRYKNNLTDGNYILPFALNVVVFKDLMDLNLSTYDVEILDNLNTAFKKEGFIFKVEKSTSVRGYRSLNNFLEEYQEFEEVGYITVLVYTNETEAEFNGIASGIPGTTIGVNLSRLSTSTLPHEMGHALGLRHIFAPDETDGLNNIYGDQVCDTPQHNIMHNQTHNCKYHGPVKFTEEQLQVIIPNYLNYNHDNVDCRDRFTAVQSIRMRWMVANYPTLEKSLR